MYGMVKYIDCVFFFFWFDSYSQAKAAADCLREHLKPLDRLLKNPPKTKNGKEVEEIAFGVPVYTANLVRVSVFFFLFVIPRIG